MTFALGMAVGYTIAVLVVIAVQFYEDWIVPMFAESTESDMTYKP